MKILTVIEYIAPGGVNYSLTAIDSHKIAYSGNTVVVRLEPTKYCDIFDVFDREDIQKFKKCGLDIKDFYPMTDCSRVGTKYSQNVVQELCEWAGASRIWIYRGQRMTGPDRKKFDEFFKSLEWITNDK